MNSTATIDRSAAADVYPPDTSSVPWISTPRLARRSLRDFCELAKPRMNLLVVATTLVGYYMSRAGLDDYGRLLLTLVGTALTAGSAGALNQYAERGFDALMPRTANRPLPAGRLRAIEALLFGLALAVAGVLVLAVFVNLLTALIGASTIAIYLLIYTPAKRRTPLCTIIGAIPGAMPAMMGFTAADGVISAQAVALFAIVFLWQIPHFLAIAIIYRRDYADGGFSMLPVVDRHLDLTGRLILLYSIALGAATLIPVFLGMAGSSYCTAAVVLGSAFSGFAFACARSKTHGSARHLFLASIVFLPLLLAAMAFNRPCSHYGSSYASAHS
jgi:protoheme IX farnesyltransferase